MTSVFSAPLSLDDFTGLLACHGADLSRWPQEAIKPAIALMETDVRARELFAEGERLDDLLRRGDASCGQRIAARHGVTAPALQARIFAAINDGAASTPAISAVVAGQAVAAQRGSFFGIQSLFAPGGSLLMIGFVGFMMGFMDPASAQDSLLDGLVHGQDMVIAGDSDAATMGEW